MLVLVEVDRLRFLDLVLFLIDLVLLEVLLCLELILPVSKIGSHQDGDEQAEQRDRLRQRR
jgi:hypothetical protein